MRHVAKIPGLQVLSAMAILIVGSLSTAYGADGASVRIASYQTPSGDAYFAASIQPSADDDLMKSVREAPADVVIVVDTSASQVGSYRLESNAAAEAILSRLRSTDRVRVFAGDVQAAPLSNQFDSPAAQSTVASIAKLRKRLPLGNTNMVSVIDSVRASLLSQPSSHTRSIVYIGDGTSIDAASNEKRFSVLVDALRADHIAVHSIAIGPSTNVELMGILANQTGGVLTAPEPSTTDAAARSIGTSATMSPIWLTETRWLDGMEPVHGKRLPPLRLDRDTIVLGKVGVSKPGHIQFSGQTSAATVQFSAESVVEKSHPDFAFLPGLVKDANENGGLTLPTAGSALLREVARVRTLQSQELVRAGKLALQKGNKRGAKVVAELALEADPNNPEARALEKVSGNRLVMQNPGDSPFDDIFGGDAGPAAPAAPAADAPAAGGDPFGGGGDVFGGGDTPPVPTDSDVFGGGAAEPAAGGDVFGGTPDMAADPGPAVADTDVFGSPEPAPAPMMDKAQPAPAGDFGLAGPGQVIDEPQMLTPQGSTGRNLGSLIGDDELIDRGGDMLRRVEQERSRAEGRLQAAVRADIRASQTMLRSNPVGVSKKLKSLLSNVENTPDIDPQLRQELTAKVRSAIQIASGREAEFIEEQFNLEQKQAGATAAARLLEEKFRREATLSTLSKQMNALIDEGRYTEADGTVSLPFAKIAGDTITRDSVAGRHFTYVPLALQTYARDRRYTEMRERNFVDAFSLVSKSNIPFVDDPSIQYPDAAVWQRLSRRRLDRYGAIELVGDNSAERRIEATLDDETTLPFVETPLEEAIQTISRQHDIPIIIDKLALEEIGMTPDTPVNVDLKNVSLRSAMRIMLRELSLTYMIKDEVMQITTEEAAELNLINKVYPVGDLVVPIIQLGGGGGGGGGLGGGGGGGGLGGGGGGLGGGGGGGAGGFGGGGAFAVPDEISLESKSASEAAKPATEAAPAADPKTVRRDQINVTAIHIKPEDGQSIDEAWDQFYAGLQIKTAMDLTVLDQRVRTTVRHHSIKANNAQKAGDNKKSIAHFKDARDTIAAALRAGHAQPWMYQVYALSLKATGAPKAEVERALLSAVDFAETPEEILNVAMRLEDISSYAAALRLCRNVADLDEYRREPYVMGLRLAEKVDDVDALTWACRGVLSHAWPEKFKPVVDHAKLVARATYTRLIEEGQKEEAAKFNRELKLAADHDAIVRVRWTGDADVDVAVEEPSGTVCSLENSSTASGGTLLGDSFPGIGKDASGAVAETYVCPKGFSGNYRVLLRRVWGNVSTGNVTIDILTDVGRPSQRFIRKQIPLTEKDALVIFEVKDGRRQQEIAEAQLEHLRDVQRDIRGNVLAQFAGDDDSEQVLQDLFRDIQRSTGGAGAVGNPGFAGDPRGFIRNGAVGFRPEITTIDEGASLSGLAIISADRRYVRITPIPIFQQIGSVTTFNFVDGEDGGDGG